MKNIAIKHIQKLDNLYNSNNGISLNINYQIIFENNKYISIYFLGDIQSPATAYPSKLKSTLDINVEKSSTMRLNKIANINEKFIDIFNKSLKSKFQLLSAQIPNTFKLDNLNTLLQQADNNDNYISEVQSYFTSNSVIILSVPHAIVNLFSNPSSFHPFILSRSSFSSAV